MSKETRQIAILYASMITSIALGIATSTVASRLLGPRNFGDMAFVRSLYEFVAIFLPLGFFYSSARLLAQHSNAAINRDLIGASYLIVALQSIVMILFFTGASALVDPVFRNGLGGVTLLFAPLLFMFPLQTCMLEILKGTNRILLLSFVQIGPRALYLIGLLAVSHLIPLTMQAALGLQFASVLLILIPLAIHLRPRADRLRDALRMLRSENVSYGFPVYIGSLADVAAVQLGVLMIGYFLDTTTLGFYSLALIIARTLILLPDSIATVFFKRFSNSLLIPGGVLRATIALSFASWLVFVLILPKAVILLYTSRFEAVIPLALILSLGCALHGLGNLFGRFIGAHGRGRALRNTALLVGGVNILGYSMLVPHFGARGAAVTNLLADMVYFAMLAGIYARLARRLRSAPAPPPLVEVEVPKASI